MFNSSGFPHRQGVALFWRGADAGLCIHQFDDALGWDLSLANIWSKGAGIPQGHGTEHYGTKHPVTQQNWWVWTELVSWAERGGGVRTEPVRVGQNTAGEGGSEHKWSGWVRTKLVNVESEQNRSGWGQNKFDSVGQNRPCYGGSEQNWLGYVRTDLVMVGQNRTG